MLGCRLQQNCLSRLTTASAYAGSRYSTAWKRRIEDDGKHDYSCDCDLYNMYLTCLHSIFVHMKVGVLVAEYLTTRMGRVRVPGLTRKNLGPYTKNDEEPLPKRRLKSNKKNKGPREGVAL